MATVVLGTAQGADDVVQDATVRAWRAIDSVDPDLGFRSWYLSVVANAARNDRRSRGRRAALALRVAGRTEPDADGPEQLAVTASERATVLAALNALDTDDRLVLALRHFEQLTEREMAEVLGCAAGTVKSRLSRASARLRRRLESELGRDADAEEVAT